MGLSDTERRSYVYSAIQKLNELNKELKQVKDNYYKTETIQELIDQTWPAFLGNSCNGLHWFLGSSASNKVGEEPSSPWERALVNHLEKVAGKIVYDDGRSIVLPHDDEEYTFNAVKHCNIEHLLDLEASKVFEIFAWTEQLVYGLRRYDDEFLKNYTVLSDLISRIQGECFGVFNSDNDYARAYLIHEITKIIYSEKYPYQEDKYDTVTKLMESENFHHDIPAMMKWDLDDIVKLHVKLVKDSSEYNRLIAVLDIVKSLFKYDHIKKKCIAEIKTMELTREENKAIMDKIKENQKKYDDNKKDEPEYNSIESNLNCYGGSGYHLAEDEDADSRELAKSRLLRKKKKKS